MCYIPQCDGSVGVVAHGKFIYVHVHSLSAVEVYTDDGTRVTAWEIPARWNRKKLLLRATCTSQGLDLIVLSYHDKFCVYTTYGVPYSEFSMPHALAFGSSVVCGDQIVVLQWYRTATTFSLTGEILHRHEDAFSPWVKLCSHRNEILASGHTEVVVLKQGNWQPQCEWKLPMEKNWLRWDGNYETQCFATDGHVVFANRRFESRRQPSIVNVLRKTDGRLVAVWQAPVGVQALSVSSAGHRLVCCFNRQFCVVYALE